MSIISESSFWNRVRRHLTGFVKRIENTVERGTPDVYIVENGRQFWIELKVDKGSGVLVRNEQYIWLRQLTAEGIDCYVVAWIGLFAIWKFPFDMMVMKNHRKITSMPNQHSDKFKEIVDYLYKKGEHAE